MPNYQLAISNIAWQKDDDETVYAAMQQAGFTGLELAPTRIFSEAPYENLTSALLFGGYLKTAGASRCPVCKASGTARRAISLTLPTLSTCWTTRHRRSSLPTA